MTASRIDMIARERHFLDHLAPIWHALPAEARGVMAVPHTLASRAERHQVAALPYRDQAQALASLRTHRGPVVVASYGDLLRANQTLRPVVFCEHGAGQSYSNRHSSYAGGAGQRQQVVLYLCPNEYAAERDRRFHPRVPAVVVGCPKLDRWHDKPAKPRSEPPVVAISFHWHCLVCPETRGAFAHYRAALAGLKRAGWQLLGHGHPRIINELANTYRTLGIPVARDFEEVLERADLYAVDNSSTLFEFAALDRPVVVLNAPWYRRGARHGLRFWECADVGIQCERPADLVPAIRKALRDPADTARRRRQIIERVYPYRGDAAQRAAAAIF